MMVPVTPKIIVSVPVPAVQLFAAVFVLAAVIASRRLQGAGHPDQDGCARRPL